MKNIMLSIRPEWLQKILSGQKTVELRLSRPNLTPPFMVFLYCSCKGTKKPGEILEIHSGGKIYKANGLVVGEFTRVRRKAPAFRHGDIRHSKLHRKCGFR